MTFSGAIPRRATPLPPLRGPPSPEEKVCSHPLKRSGKIFAFIGIFLSAAHPASKVQRPRTVPPRTILPRTFRLELLCLAPSKGRRSSDSERSAEPIRKHDEPTPFLLPKVLTRVSTRSESADERRPRRLERPTSSNLSISNCSASNSKQPRAFRLIPSKGGDHRTANAARNLFGSTTSLLPSSYLKC